jgi:uncharacterized protein YbcC (UPF0753/DUF2309 family)
MIDSAQTDLTQPVTLRSGMPSVAPESAHDSSAHDPGLLAQAVQAACLRIAPSWPLDRFIAVNPWWGFVDAPLQAASAHINHLCGSLLAMPMDWYLDRHAEGQITDSGLREALRRRGLAPDADAFRRQCAAGTTGQAQPAGLMLLTEALDARRDLRHLPACQDVVIHAMGQHCASWFDQGQARWRPTHAASLYAAWQEIASHDDGPSMLLGMDGIAGRIAALPAQHGELIGFVCRALRIGPDEYQAYFTALLLSVNGWAAWCAYLRWQAGQQGQPDDHLEQLLAIRLAWEWVLADCAADEALLGQWRAARRAPGQARDDSPAWVWQDALDISWQQQVSQGLLRPAPPASAPPARPAMQAVFCIDVRSEPMRRALEASDPAIRTHGFAGFFGLPIEYLPFAGRDARPQLPGLLAPQLRVAAEADTPKATAQLQASRRFRLGLSQAWEGFRTTASSGFGFVETAGLGYAWKLLRASMPGKAAAGVPGADSDGLSPGDYARLRPVLGGMALADAVRLAAGVLGAMSMHGGFAPLVLLIGHGSQTANNPHAAGLDCGACCGQTGEVNARVLAGLLNRSDIRAGLAAQGMALSEDTRFVSGLHNTTTDEITLLDTQELHASHGAALAQARQWLAQAGQRIRAERAPALGLAAQAPEALMEALRQRAGDWSQVRPEWGLANNAGFIAAPRERTRHLNLQGRSFLHDYSHLEDAGYGVLELILTAPMVVAHWINMQYYASTVDNRRWGSGNKVLHNVVGANIGVFEGNGGDLRIGLPMQSLHDGTRWVHTPLRLSVWVEAPREAISGIVQRHEKVAQLVAGGWLHLLCIEPQDGQIYRHAAAQGSEGSVWVPEPLVP